MFNSVCDVTSEIGGTFESYLCFQAMDYRLCERIHKSDKICKFREAIYDFVEETFDPCYMIILKLFFTYLRV